MWISKKKAVQREIELLNKIEMCLKNGGNTNMLRNRGYVDVIGEWHDGRMPSQLEAVAEAIEKYPESIVKRLEERAKACVELAAQDVLNRKVDAETWAMRDYFMDRVQFRRISAGLEPLSKKQLRELNPEYPA